MVIDTLVEFVGLLVALSAASERLVDIIKGIHGGLEKPDPPNTLTPKAEARRRAKIQGIAVVAGVLTALLAWPIIGGMLPGTLGKNFIVILGLGFLVSGGSGLWNSILAYLLAIKDLKKNEVRKLQADGVAETPPGET